MEGCRPERSAHGEIGKRPDCGFFGQPTTIRACSILMRSGFVPSFSKRLPTWDLRRLRRFNLG